VPVEALEKPDAQLVTQKLEELVPLGARPATAIEAPGQPQPAAAAVEAPRRHAPPAAADIVDVAPKQPAASRETALSTPEPQLAAASPPVSATPFKTAVVEVGPMTLSVNGRASVAAAPAPPDIPAGDAAVSPAAPTVPATDAQPPSTGAARVVVATKDSQRRPVARVSEVLSRSAAPGILLAPHSPDNPGTKKNGEEDADPVEQINTPVVSYPASRKGQA
jgi:hypothetical protein